MDNVFHKKNYNAWAVKVHMETAPIPNIEGKNDEKLDTDFVKIKLRRDMMSENLHFYEFKMALFDNGDPEELFLFISNFNMNIEASVTLKSGTNIQYLHTLVHGEALCKF